MNRKLVALAAASLVVGLAPAATAEGMLFPGTRALGVGGALRALATGDAGPMLNPSGISLIRAYAVEAAYQYGRTLGSNDVRLSAVDSTSAFNLGGALYYSYHRDAPAGGGSQAGHLVGGALSFPFVDKVYLGMNLKYVRFTDLAQVKHSGLTLDGGLTLRLIPQLSLGAAAYNVIDLDTAWAPRGYGGGVAVLPFPALLLAFDVVSTKVYGDPDRDQALSFMGGGEFSLGTAAGLRAGGGRDGVTRNGYMTAGFTLISAQLGALDFGFRQDVSGEDKSTILGVSARLFVPSM